MACSAPEVKIPILTEETIISSIKDYINIPCSITDLRQPTTEKLDTIYRAFVCSLLEMSNEQITLIPLHVMETIGHRDLHVEDGAGHALFCKALAYMMESCGIPDFNMSDITNPTKKRTRKLLSAIVNYVQFSTQYNHLKGEIFAKLEIITKDQENIIKKKEILSDKLINLKSQRLERQRAVQELNLSAMKARYQEIEDLKKEKLANAAKIKAEVEEMRNLQTVARSSILIHEGKEAVDLCKARLNIMVVKEELVTQMEEIAPSALRLIKDTEHDVMKCQVLTNDLEKVDDSTLELSKKMKNILANKHNVESLINVKLDKKERAAAQNTKKNKIVKDTETKLLNKDLIMQEELKNKQEEICKILEEEKQLTELTSLSKEEHNDAMTTMENKFKSLQSKIKIYNDKVIKAYE